MTNVSNTLSNLLHAVFINMGMVVQLPKILDNSEPLALFLGTQKSGEL